MEVYEITFSPTGGTKRVSDCLLQSFEGECRPVDLTDSQMDFQAISLAPDDVAVIAAPSYGGRVPATAAERLTKIHGNGARAILICVYGNRAYEDTLVELEDAAKQAGFRVIAAVAAIAEHSIAHQFATGRPDEKDAQQLGLFGQQIRKKLLASNDSEPNIPGNRPYKKAGGAGMVPKATKDCVKCGTCAKACPGQAIQADDPHKVDERACISCMRCISVCPQNARKVNPIMLSAGGVALKKACSVRKECELFL